MVDPTKIIAKKRPNLETETIMIHPIALPQALMKIRRTALQISIT